jgi:hypothetical protein
VGLSRQAEVEDLDAPVAGDEEVLGLQVAVHDALLVRGGQPLGDLPSVLDRLLRGQRSGGHELPQRLPLEELGDRVVAAPGLAELEDGQDVRVGERGHRLRLPLEPGERIGLGEKPRGQDLDRDVAVELLVTRPKHLAHAASPEGRDDPVGAEGCAGLEKRDGWCRSFGQSQASLGQGSPALERRECTHSTTDSPGLPGGTRRGRVQGRSGSTWKPSAKE